jgi:ribosome recycling factor
MEPIIEGQISSAEEKMTSYLLLLSYRYMNLCVKAEMGALMPVSILTTTGPKDLENVADVGLPNEYQFAIIPKSPDLLQNIIHGIFDAHPEFKMEIKAGQVTYVDNDHMPDAMEWDGRYLLYTMPSVDKNRRDLLNEAVKSLHKECVARLNMTQAEKIAFAVGYLKEKPGDIPEAKEVFESLHDEYKMKADEILQNKLDEIEEGYQRYLVYEADQEQNVTPDFDYSHGMRLDQDQE